jgi:P-type E1-E2 ATPase
MKTLIFLIAVMSLNAFGIASSVNFTISALVALFVCLIPTTMGGLLSAIGIAGIDRLAQKNVLVSCGRAVEAAGDVDVLLLDKTGTVTIGNRQATSFLPVPGLTEQQLACPNRLRKTLNRLRSQVVRRWLLQAKKPPWHRSPQGYREPRSVSRQRRSRCPPQG